MPLEPCAVTKLGALASRRQRAVDLKPLLDEVDPDLVHVHNVMNPRVLEALSGWPVVVTVQDHRTFCPGRGKLTESREVCNTVMSQDVCAACFRDETYFQDMTALTQRRFETLRDLPLVVLSEYMARELRGMGASRVHVVPPFVHGLTRTSTQWAPCVLFVGRLVEAKGVWDTVKAWQRSGLELPLVFVGAGPEADALAEVPGVRTTGWVSHETLSSWYACASVVVMPSRWQEPFGIVGLEALSLGTPVAAWESGGVAEWHPGPLCAWGDVEALARQIRTLAGTTVVAPAGYQRAAKMAELEQVYRTIV